MVDSAEETSHRKAVIVGGGVAGTSCALYLHELLPSVEIVLIDPKPSLKLCRLLSPITETIAETEIDEQDAEKWCRQRNITFVRSHATRISTTSVTIEDGAQIKFDTCCIACGARPFIPSSLNDPSFSHYVLTLRDTDSVERLRSKLRGVRRVLVVGAGGIGMEVVHEITGCEIVWVVKHSHIGGLFFDERIASFIEQRREQLNAEENRPEAVNSSKVDSDKGSHRSKPDSTAPYDMHEAVSKKTAAAAVGPHWIGERERATLFDSNGNAIISDDAQKSQQGGRLKAKDTSPEDKLKSLSLPSLEIITECEVTGLRKDDGCKSDRAWNVIARLSNGKEIGCDMIIVGTGVCTNVEWTYGNKDLTFEYNGEDNGIIVHPSEMRTNHEHIFAAGDCANVVEDLSTDWVQVRTWGQALAGGRVAANGMAKILGLPNDRVGFGLEFDVFTHSTRFFGLRVVLLGRWKAQGLGVGFTILERSVEAGQKSFVRVVLENGRVRGAVLVGDVDNAEVFENLIVGQMDVSWMGEDLVDESIDLENYFD